MHTLAPARTTAMGANLKAASKLLNDATLLGRKEMGGRGSKGEAIATKAAVFQASNNEIIDFIKAYHWLESDFTYPDRPLDALLQIEFLENQKHGIASWLIIAPQRNESFGSPVAFGRVGDMTVKERHRAGGRGFQVFGEPDHRAVAHYLAGVKSKSRDLAEPNETTGSMRDLHRGICLLYPVRETTNDEVTIGFELLFPNNELEYDVNFAVRSKSSPGVIVTL
jgi:hypothetical protein